MIKKKKKKNPTANAGDAGDVALIMGGKDLPEEEMAVHSSILAWKVSWTEEPGGLSLWNLRVRHDWAAELTCVDGPRVR